MHAANWPTKPATAPIAAPAQPPATAPPTVPVTIVSLKAPAVHWEGPGPLPVNVPPLLKLGTPTPPEMLKISWVLRVLMTFSVGYHANPSRQGSERCLTSSRREHTYRNVVFLYRKNRELIVRILRTAIPIRWRQCRGVFLAEIMGYQMDCQEVNAIPHS